MTSGASAWVRAQLAEFWKAIVGVLAVAVAGWLLRRPLADFLLGRAWVEIAHWQVIALVLAGILLFIAGWIGSRRGLLGGRPRWERYTTDLIGGIRWAWRWPRINLATAGPEAVRELVRGLRPVCPDCGGVLYNPLLDLPGGYAVHPYHDAPHVEENELACMTCTFQRVLATRYDQAALLIAGDIIRRARQKFVRGHRGRGPKGTHPL